VGVLYVYENVYGDIWEPEDTLYTPKDRETSDRGVGFRNLTAADFDQDGYIEVYFFSGGVGWIYKWVGEREVEMYRAAQLSTNYTLFTTVTDYNDNGIPDVLSVGNSLDNDGPLGATLEVSIDEFAEVIDYYDGWQYYTTNTLMSFATFQGKHGDISYTAALGDFDHDGEKEIALDRGWGWIPGPFHNECRYLDRDESGQWEMKEFASRLKGYDFTPIVGDVDGDGEDEWISQGIAVNPDFTSVPLLRVIEADAQGSLVETFLDTTWNFVPAFHKAVSFVNFRGRPTLATFSPWFDPEEERPDTIAPSYYLGYSVVSFLPDGNAEIISSAWTHSTAASCDIYLDDPDGDGLANLSIGSELDRNRILILEETPATSVEPPSNANPGRYSIGTPYPNPFNSALQVQVHLPEARATTVTVYDLQGRLVERIAVPARAGTHRITWNATGVASGVYFLRWNGNPSQTRKVVLIR